MGLSPSSNWETKGAFTQECWSGKHNIEQLIVQLIAVAKQSQFEHMEFLNQLQLQCNFIHCLYFNSEAAFPLAGVHKRCLPSQPMQMCRAPQA